MSIAALVKAVENVRDSVKARNVKLVTFENVVKVKKILQCPSSTWKNAFEKNDHNYYVELGGWLPPGFYHKSENFFRKIHGDERGKGLYELEHLHDSEYFLFFYNEIDSSIIRGDDATFQRPDEEELCEIYADILVKDLQRILESVPSGNCSESTGKQLQELLAQLEIVE